MDAPPLLARPVRQVRRMLSVSVPYGGWRQLQCVSGGAAVIFYLHHQQARDRAKAAIHDAPEGWVVRISEPTRSLEQNARMWAMLTDISKQVLWPCIWDEASGMWHMDYMTPESWKHLFTASLKGQTIIQGIDGNQVAVGYSTSDMTVRQLSDLIEVISAFGAERDVRWSE